MKTKQLNATPDQATLDPSRRKFLSGSAAAMATVSVAPGVTLVNIAQARIPEQAVSSEDRWGMLIDTEKCADGCTACVDACNEENGLNNDEKKSSDKQKAQWIRKVSLRDKTTGKEHSLPLLCQHCENPPCVDVCPTGASFRREDGIVLVDKHICIGCRYCMMACPYKARSFIHEALENQKEYAPRGKGTVESCTFCVHRVDKEETPACVEACTKDNHNAMIFGNMNNPTSELSVALKKYSTREIRPDLGLNTGVRYKGI